METEEPDDITTAIGVELRRSRTSQGWSRPELIARMKVAIPVNTYACYEQGIRQCSIPRLVEICEALGVGAPELLDLALRRHGLDSVEVRLLREIRDLLDRVLRSVYVPDPTPQEDSGE